MVNQSYNLDELKKISENPNDPRYKEIVDTMWKMTLKEAENAIRIAGELEDNTFLEKNKEAVIDLKKEFDKEAKLAVESHKLKSVLQKINDNTVPNPLFERNTVSTYLYYLQLLVDCTENENLKNWIDELRKEDSKKTWETKF